MLRRFWALWVLMGVISCKADVAPFDFENLAPIELTEFDDAPAPVPPDTPVAPESPDAAGTLALDGWSGQSCPAGTIPLVGSASCEPIGWTCPEGLWATTGASDGDVFVSPGGSGDGRSQNAPLASIQDALDSATDGATVWLSKGLYEESITISRGVTLQGVCVAETIILSTGASGVRIQSEDTVTLRGFTLREGDTGVLIEPEATAVSIDSLHVIHATGFGLEARGGEGSLELEMSNLDLSSASIQRGNVALSRAVLGGLDVTSPLSISDRANVSGESLFVHAGMVTISGMANVSLTNFVLLDGGISQEGEDCSLSIAEGIIVGAESSEAGGNALSVGAGNANLVSVGVTETNGFGIQVHGADSSFYGRDLWIEQRSPAGTALGVVGGAYASVDRIYVSLGGSEASGVQVSGQNTEFNGRSVVVEVTGESSESHYGILVTDAAWSTLEHTELRGVGLMLESEQVDVDVTDLTVSNTATPGIDIRQGASLTLERGHIENALMIGVRVTGEGTDLRAQDLVVRDTAPSVSHGSGYGLQVSGGSTTVLERTRFEANHEAGIVGRGAGTKVTASDLTVVGTLSRATDGLRGGGLYASGGIDLQLVRAKFDSNRDVGISVEGVDTNLFASSLVVQSTSGVTCAGDTLCSDSGVGLFCEDASCLVGEFELSNNALCGMVLAAAGGTPGWDTDWFLAQRGLITANRVGLDIQTEDFNPNKSLVEVYNFGNSEVDFSGRSIVLGEHPEIR